MKNIITLLLTITLFNSCTSEDLPASGPICPISKTVFSNWTSSNGALEVDMSAGQYESDILIQFGPGACSNGRGDFIMRVSQNGRMEFRPCENNSTLDFASWDIDCRTLSIKYDADGVVETYK